VVDVANAAQASVDTVVLPSRDDPVIAAGSDGFGGVAGSRVRGLGPRRAIATALILTALVCCLGLLQKQPCRASAWNSDSIYPELCYSDIAFLYRLRGGVAEGHSPYSSADGAVPLEYPVLTGAMVAAAAGVTSWLAGGSDDIDRSRTFFDVTVVMLAGCALLATWAIARTAGRRPWDAMLFAVAPGLLLTAYINWDLLPAALTACSLLAWARRRPGLSGVLLGLGIAAKFYPLFLLGPFLLLCLRAGRMRAFGRMLLGAAVAWTVVNLPVALRWPDGWASFYTMSRTRDASFGSPWYALDRSGWVIPSNWLSAVSAGSFALLCVGIGVLALGAPRRPRVGQLAFLVVAAFTITNKVYSPQYVLWLIALFPLARPRWRDFLVWQGAEVVYFVAVWWHLQGITYPDKVQVPEWTHTGATFLRIGVLGWVCGMIVRDVLRPDKDPVRADGSDDPAGGVLDGAADRFRLFRRGWLADDDLVEGRGGHPDVDVELAAHGRDGLDSR
jgi:uncharacterized membrane protein